MVMFKWGCVVLLLFLTSACSSSNSSTPTGPSSFTIAVTSPNANVLLGATEPMTATASDGRSLSGAWSSDNLSVATVSTTGIVTATGPGQASIIFKAGSGQSGTKVLRGLPNLNGTFSGNYSVTSCSSTGFNLTSNLCDSFAVGTLLPYTFNFTQSNDVVSGRFFLGAVEFDNLSGTIGVAGNLGFSGVNTSTGIVLNASWDLTASRSNTLSGNLALLWTSTLVAGTSNISGSISTIARVASVPQRTVLRSRDDVIRAFRGL